MSYPVIFIPTKNRPKTISTHKYFSEFDYRVLVHSYEQKAIYLREDNGIEPSRIVVTDVPGDQFGLTRQREWACKNLAEKDQWFIFADDNIRDIQAVDNSVYHFPGLDVQNNPGLKSLYQTHCPPERFAVDIFNECVSYAEQAGANHLGFAVVDNFFFRGSKWKKVAYIIGKLMLWKNTGNLQFDHTITMEDFELTAQSILKFGCAPVNNYVYPVAGHYESGGMGTKKERLPDRQRDMELLQKKYPGLFNMKIRPDGNPDLSLRFHTLEAAANWRKSFKVAQSPKSIWR